MKKNYLQLKGEVERYWLRQLNGLILTYGNDGKSHPWITVNGDAIQECLGLAKSEEVENFIKDNISPFNIEKILDDELLICQLYRAYEDLKKFHNGRKRQLSTMVAALINRYNETSFLAPDQKELSESIEGLSNMLEFSSMLLEYLQGWFTHFGISPKALKNPKSLDWNPVLSRLVNAFTVKQAGRNNMEHTDACHNTAKLLAIIYPKIWGKDDLFDNGELIRQRMYRMDNK